MAVMVVPDVDDELSEILVARLVAQGDEVRVIEPEAGLVAGWRRLGAFVARGDAEDASFMEQALLNVRTVVLIGGRANDETIARPVIEGASRASVGRVVLCAPSIRKRHLLEGWSGSYVLIASGSGGLFRRRALTPAQIAEAIDAADDLAGDPRLEVDLTTTEGRSALGLMAP